MAVLCSGNSIAVSAQDLPQTTEGLGQTAVETEEIFEEETDADSDAEIEVPEETETEISQEPGLDTEEAEAEEIQNIQEETADEAQGLFSDGVSAGTEEIFMAEEESQPETEAVDVYFSVLRNSGFLILILHFMVCRICICHQEKMKMETEFQEQWNLPEIK